MTKKKEIYLQNLELHELLSPVPFPSAVTGNLTQRCPKFDSGVPSLRPICKGNSGSGKGCGNGCGCCTGHHDQRSDSFGDRTPDVEAGETGNEREHSLKSKPSSWLLSRWRIFRCRVSRRVRWENNPRPRLPKRKPANFRRGGGESGGDDEEECGENALREESIPDVGRTRLADSLNALHKKHELHGNS